MKLYHVTTEKKAKQYHASGCIHKPVRGFDSLQSAMAWAIKTGRKVIYLIDGTPAYKLPDHHNEQDGKSANNYYVCNLDEPYAEKVLQAILDGEDAKAPPTGETKGESDEC